MNLLFYLPIATTLVFGAAAAYFSFLEEKTKKLLKENDQKQKQRIYQITVLKEIQDRIGYSLDAEKVVDVITGSLRSLFPYSSVSSLLIKRDHMILKTYLDERVSTTYTNQVKKYMLISLATLLEKPLPVRLDESLTGNLIDETNTLFPASFFNIPLVVNENVVGLINISSTKPNLYKEDEMTILYQIINQASQALSKLQSLLMAEKGKLTAMITSLADGVFMIDTNNQLVVINNTAKDLLGINKEEPTVIDVFSSLPNTYDFATLVEQVIAQNKAIEKREIKLNDRFIEVYITPVQSSQLPIDRTQAIIGASVLLHDITLAKSLEQMKQDFTNVIVHELKAPITAIKGASELMAQSGNKLQEDEKIKLLELIDEQSKKLLDEVSSLLDAASVEAKQFVLQKTLTDIRQIISRQVMFFQAEAQQKHIALNVNLQSDLPMALIDQKRMAQVMNNLISNSLKFTPEGGAITVIATKQENNLHVSVSDTGIGIPKDKQDKLFTKFYHITPVSSAAVSKLQLAPGTGLGLYIVKGVVEAHGGSVSLISDVGKGTTVTFTLPLQAVVIDKPQPEPYSSPFALHLKN